VLRSRVFVALHMHAGDGNVHTNIPVNSDDYGMLQEANAAVAASWRWRVARRRDFRRARHRHHQARIPDRRGLAPFIDYKQRVDPARAASTPASCCPGATCRAYTPSFSLLGTESADHGA
jgi:FAD/FMN-containing dehydrogenase